MLTEHSHAVSSVADDGWVGRARALAASRRHIRESVQATKEAYPPQRPATRPTWSEMLSLGVGLEERYRAQAAADAADTNKPLYGRLR